MPPSKYTKRPPLKPHRAETELTNKELGTPGPAHYSGSKTFGRNKSEFGSNKANGAFFGSAARPWQNQKLDGVPGPGQYTLKSSMRTQTDSNCKSANRAVFGTAPRNQVNKMYISAEHARVNNRSAAPGPGRYELGSSLRTQHLSTKNSSTRVRIGRGTRDDAQKIFVSNAMAQINNSPRTPGPGTYEANKSSVAAQANSTKESAPAYKIGTAPKCQKDTDNKHFMPIDQQRVLQGNNSPGPIYKPGDSSIFKKEPHPVTTFGLEARLQLTAAQKDVQLMPAADMYQERSCIGEQTRGRTEPAYSIGTSSRAHREKLSGTHHL